MKTIHAVIIDSEKNSITILSQMLLKHCPEVTIEATATIIAEGEKLILKHQPNLIIVAIEMHEGNDFQLFDHLLPHHYSIIFTTKNRSCTFFPDLVYDAIHFLLKPFDADHLTSIIHKVTHLINDQKDAELIAIAAEELHHANLPVKRVFLNSTDIITVIQVANIMYISSNNHCTFIHLVDDTKETSTHTLHYWVTLLRNNGFIQIHNSTLLNPDYIKQYNKGRGGSILLINNTKLDVSENGFKELKMILI